MHQSNAKIKLELLTSHVLVFDESMSAFIPRCVYLWILCIVYTYETNLSILFALIRTTKTGNLPNLSYVKRKPEPLGTEFKNIVDGLIGVMLWMEIQEGKVRMSTKEFQSLGSTCACVLRGVMSTSHYKPVPIEDRTEDTE